VSDHRLIKARLSLGWRWQTLVTYKFCQLNEMNFDAFEAAMLSSTLFSAPAETADSFAEQ